MTRATKGRLIKGSAIALDVGAPFVATLTQFPVWVERSSEATVSGLFLIFAFLSAIPFWREIKKWMKSPSAPILFTVLAIIFIVLRNIIDEMVIVFAVGAVANWCGAGIYKIGGVFEKERGDS